jgi:hypothetical protein
MGAAAILWSNSDCCARSWLSLLTDGMIAGGGMIEGAMIEGAMNEGAMNEGGTIGEGSMYGEGVDGGGTIGGIGLKMTPIGERDSGGNIGWKG